MTGAILALDLGNVTGWALRTADGQITSGSQNFRLTRYDGDGLRFLRFERWLTELKGAAGGIAEVHFEEVRRHLGVDAAHVYGEFLATLTSWCEQHQMPYNGVPVGTIKKRATGKANADKAAIVAAMRARGFVPAGNKDAGALALLTMVVEGRWDAAMEIAR